MNTYNGKTFVQITYHRIALSGGTAIYSYDDGLTIFEPYLKTTRDTGKSKAKWVRHWLSESKDPYDYDQPTTGMFNSGEPRFMYGDLNQKKDLVIFELWEMGNVLKIYFFPKFYPKNARGFTKKFAINQYERKGD
ncbi:hypothetical protein [Flagellimonas marinaquae]|uniref:hypothetical protein n=1 Tax=Flagellimonas marinaquae TaxID=254955 RepID=UPI0020752813|nr:hypothetical protein [Allomuricauda aquimarina]USD24068.1 hypothetical protein MJO53_10275 [Allomuricauda aquimarina]